VNWAVGLKKQQTKGTAEHMLLCQTHRGQPAGAHSTENPAVLPCDLSVENEVVNLACPFQERF